MLYKKKHCILSLAKYSTVHSLMQTLKMERSFWKTSRLPKRFEYLWILYPKNYTQYTQYVDLPERKGSMSFSVRSLKSKTSFNSTTSLQDFVAKKVFEPHAIYWLTKSDLHNPSEM